MPETPPLVHMDALPTGTRLGEFEVQGLLGVGGFGMVYRGYDHSLHRAVAIKEYMPAALVGRTDGLQVVARSAADQQPFQSGLTSFMAEARLLARFDHPSLVKVYRFWEAHNTAYMAMPLYSGITLKQARSQMSGPPPEVWLRTVMWSVLEALKVLHASQTLHRDVSPDNIFLQDVGPPVLLDLGSARRAITESSHKHTAVLKVNYAPIEQYADAQGLSEGAWTDLYALAAVIHGCVCNDAPVPATFRVVQDRMPTFASVAHTAQAHFGISHSQSFCQAIDHALALQPTDRPASVDAWEDEMQLKAPDALSQFHLRLALGPSVTLGKSPSTTDNAQTLHLHALQNTTQTMPMPSKNPHLRWLWVALVGVAVALSAWVYSHRNTLLTDTPPSQSSITAKESATTAKDVGDGQVLCGNVPFYKRTWCLHQACQKPGMSKNSACIAERKHREDAAKQPQNF